MWSFFRAVRESIKGRTFVLLVFLSLLPCGSLAGPFATLDARLSGRPDAEAVSELRRLNTDDPNAQTALQSGPEAVRAYIRLRAGLEGVHSASPPPIASATGDERIASSWLARALSRLHMPDVDLPRSSLSPALGVGNWITPLIWIALAVVGILAVFMLARTVRFSRKQGRKSAIAPDEPLRSADAWLEEANALIAQGRYREAVRGLYVAGLMRLDESGVARFDRHETNWEHLRRIESSPRRPAGVEARAATGLFDRCWYGHLLSTESHATTMRDWYDSLVTALAEAKR